MMLSSRKNPREEWRKAQVSEKEFWDRSRSVVQKATKDEWKPKVQRFLLDGFSIDFEFFKGKKTLEIGGGPIGIVRYIDEAALKVNIDPLNHEFFGGSMMEYATYHTHHLTGIGEYLPLKEGAFDVVIATNVLDHSLNPTKIISEIKRVLKQNGVLILSLNIFNLPRLIRRRLGVVDREHPHHLNDKELLLPLQDAGLRIEVFRKKSLIHDGIRMINQRLIRSGLKVLFAGLLGSKNCFCICFNPD